MHMRAGARCHTPDPPFSAFLSELALSLQGCTCVDGSCGCADGACGCNAASGCPKGKAAEMKKMVIVGSICALVGVVVGMSISRK